ncbi:MAG: 3'-5' exonuclease, partial [Bacteroidetes bacterium]
MDISKILFIDIETVPQKSRYAELSEEMKTFWDKKIQREAEQFQKTPEELYSRAGIYAEFGKIICISAGFITEKNGEYFFRIKSYYGDDEKLVLEEFAQLLNNHFFSENHYLCAHNGKEFDFPYLSRRMLIHQIPLPSLLDNAGKKPWEVKLLDTMEMWKFGDYKNYTGLNLLAYIFGIPSPKDDIDGSQIYSVYYEDGDIQRIVEYCEKDTLTVAQL